MSTSDLQAQHQPALAPAQTIMPGLSAPAITRQSLAHSLAVLGLVVLLLFIGDILMLRLHPGVHTILIGNFRDKYFLERAHRQEQEADGSTYRWTEANSTLWLNQVGVTPYTLLTLNLGGRPEAADLTLTLRDQPWVAFTAQTQPRHYTLLLPQSASEQLWIGIQSPTFRVADDPRELGVKLESFAITNLRARLPLPPLGQFASQLILLVLAQAALIRLGWGWRSQMLGLGALAIGLAVLLSSELLLTMEYMPRLVVATGVLALLTWLALPPLERWLTGAKPVVPGGIRELHLLWALTLVACGIRLIGVLYPSFGGQDLGRNLDRLLTTISGQLVIIAPSGEFARGLTIYPPGPYLGLMPGIVATGDLGSLMQGGLALMDGITCFLTAVLVYLLGGNRHAARLALVLYAGNITAFSAMSYSFSAQIYGQWFTAPLALLLLNALHTHRALQANWITNRRIWLLAMILLLFGVFSHIGVAFLAIGWMGLLLLIITISERRIPWWAWGLFAAACLLSFGLLYIEIVGVTLQHAAERVVPRSIGSGTLFPGYRILLVNGVRLAYSDIGLALLPLGLLLVRIWRYPPALAWLLTALFFLMVDLILNVQVRYFYFALPLVLAAIALFLGTIAARGRWGTLIGWALVLAVVIPQIALWYSGTWGEGKIPMTPLTH